MWSFETEFFHLGDCYWASSNLPFFPVSWSQKYKSHCCLRETLHLLVPLQGTALPSQHDSLFGFINLFFSPLIRTCFDFSIAKLLILLLAVYLLYFSYFCYVIHSIFKCLPLPPKKQSMHTSGMVLCTDGASIPRTVHHTQEYSVMNI